MRTVLIQKPATSFLALPEEFQFWLCFFFHLNPRCVCVNLITLFIILPTSE